SYYWNKNWVIESKNKDLSLFFKFLTVNLILLAFNTISLFILVDKLFINKFISQIFSIGVGMIMNFFLNKLWTFNKQKHFQ
ncbi:GtrA family protein, partial [Bacillus pseudomycoides]|nr:GtrA family protein [Bacillus pseudomycoides]